MILQVVAFSLCYLWKNAVNAFELIGLMSNRCSPNSRQFQRSSGRLCTIEYDDEKELAETHPDLLPTEGLVSNYRVITGKYRRILRFLVFLLRYGFTAARTVSMSAVLRTLGSDR